MGLRSIGLAFATEAFGVRKELQEAVKTPTIFDKTAGKLFPDHDCRNIQNPVVNWDELRETFRTACPPTKYTWSLQCSTVVVNWSDGLRFLEDYTDFPIEKGPKHAAFRRLAKQQCPLGYIVLLTVRLLHCALKQAMTDCFLPYSVAIREQVRGIDFKVFMGSDWPVFALLNTLPWDEWPGYDRQAMDFDCDRSGNSIVDWPSFRRIFDWPFDVDLAPFEASVAATHGGQLYDRNPEIPLRFAAEKREKKFRHMPLPAELGANANAAQGFQGGELLDAQYFITEEDSNEILLEELTQFTPEEQLEDEAGVSDASFVRHEDRKSGSYVYFSTKDMPKPPILDPTWRVDKRIVNPDKTLYLRGEEYRNMSAEEYVQAHPGIPSQRFADLDTLLRTPLRPFAKASQAHYYSDYRSWWLDSIKYVYAERIHEQTGVASQECLYGVYTANLIKALWAADTESSAFQPYSVAISNTFFESLHFIGASKWPIFALLEHGRSLRRHRYAMDFSEEDLDLVHKHMGPWLQSLDADAHRKALGIYVPALRSRAKRSGHPGITRESWKRSLFENDAMDSTESAAENPAMEPTSRNFNHYAEASRSPFHKLHFQETVRAIVEAGARLRFLYVSFVYGAYKKYIRGWIRRLKFLQVDNVLLYTLDQDSHEECLRFSKIYQSEAQCLRGLTISALNKFTILLVCLQLGFDVMWLDLDIFLMKNPTPTIMQMTRGNPEGRIHSDSRHNYRERHQEAVARGDNYLVNSEIDLPAIIGDDFSVLTVSGEQRYHDPVENPEEYIDLTLTDAKNDYGPEDDLATEERLEQNPEETRYDLLIAYSFVSDCICNGFFFLKSKPAVVDWLEELIVWLYQHPFEHDQRAMSALLNYTEKVGFPKDYKHPRIPNWFVFDVENEFINWPYWVGDLEKMALIHFVDGAAYSLYGRGDWDASIPLERATEASMLDVFYLDMGDPDSSRPEIGSPEMGDPEIGHPNTADQLSDWKRELVLQQRLEKSPEQRQKCGILPNVESAHLGTGWVDAKLKALRRTVNP